MAKSKQSSNDADFFTLVSNTFKLIGDSWEALKLNMRTFIFAALVPLIAIGISIPFVLTPFFTHNTGRSASISLAVVVLVLVAIVGCIFLPVITLTQLASAKSKKLSIDEAFNQSKKFVFRYLCLIILIGLSVIIGSILLIIPGLLVAFFLSMATYILIDKNIGVMDAIKQSYKLVRANWMIVLALFVVNIVVSGVSYVPFIGWLAGFVLAIAYFCLPAIVYVKISRK